MSDGAPLAILHLDTERGWRGGERQALWLAAELHRRGHRSLMVARRGEPLEQRAREAGLETVGVTPRSELALVTAGRLRALIRAAGIHVVHAHSGHAVSLAALAALGTTAVVVVTRRVNVPLRRNAGTRWKYGRARRIMAVSSAIAHTLRQGGVPDERVSVVPDGVDLSRRPARVSAEALASIGVPQGVPWVIQVAALDRGKNPMNFIRAIAAARREVPALHGVLAGSGDQEAAARAGIAALGLDGIVHLAGYRTDADALIASATVAALASDEEGLGTVLLDAMAFGTPVAATRVGGIPEVVRHEETGLLAPPRDPEALGAAMARLACDGDLARRLSVRARAFVEELSVERMAERTLVEYRRALAGA